MLSKFPQWEVVVEINNDASFTHKVIVKAKTEQKAKELAKKKARKELKLQPQTSIRVTYKPKKLVL